jgi:hypothetical protein
MIQREAISAYLSYQKFETIRKSNFGSLLFGSVDIRRDYQGDMTVRTGSWLSICAIQDLF